MSDMMIDAGDAEQMLVSVNFSFLQLELRVHLKPHQAAYTKGWTGP